MLQDVWVDDIHKVLMCVHYKGGSTTWLTILANNSAADPIPETKFLGIHLKMFQYSLYKLGSDRFSGDGIQDRLNTYYKFMVVRHPYDR